MLRALIASAAALAGPAASLGAAHSDAAHPPATPVDLRWAPFVGALLMFGIVFFVLNKKVWPVILKALKAREEKIRAEIDDAERARRQAQSALQQYEKALAEARNEAAQMLEHARIEQMKMSAELRARAEHDIVGLKEAAQRDIESSKRAAIGEIFAQMAGAATDAAARIMRRELSAADHKRLVEESLREFEEVSSRH